MLALSVSISTSSSPLETSSPSDLSHFRIVPSSIESDRRGIATSAMGRNVQIRRRRPSRRGRGRSPPGSSRSCAASSSLVGEDLGARAVGDDPAAGEDHRALAQLGGERQVVGDDEHRAVDRRRARSSSSRRARGSRLADGSSSTSRRGRIASTVAIATRRRWPSESWCGARSATSLHPHGGQRLATRSRDLVARAAEVERAEGDVLAHGRHEELVVGVLEDEARRGRAGRARRRRRRAGRRPRARPRPVSRPLRWSISVVLPAPLGPRTATRSPCATCRSTPSSADDAVRGSGSAGRGRGWRSSCRHHRGSGSSDQQPARARKTRVGARGRRARRRRGMRPA